MKIALYYDSLVTVGGAERVVFKLAEHLGADIITSGYSPQINDILQSKQTVIDIGNSSIHFLKPLGILFEAPLRYFFARKKFTYDVHVFFGYTSIFGANPHNTNIWFCFTPNRMLYDLHQEKVNHPNLLVRLFFHFYSIVFRKSDQLVVKNNFKKIIAQTNTVKDRIKKYYNKSSTVIYSPVDTSMFTWKSYGDYFLSIGRLFPEKRLDLIIKAFQKMTDKKLIIVGDGPEKNKLEHMIQGYPNIELRSNVSDTDIIDLYAHCKATIFMAKNEDYGLIPLEGNAAGKICIAVNEGGCRETVVDGKTGILIKPTQEAIIETVQKVSTMNLKDYKKRCEENAKRFDISNITDQWKDLLQTISE